MNQFCLDTNCGPLLVLSPTVKFVWPVCQAYLLPAVFLTSFPQTHQTFSHPGICICSSFYFRAPPPLLWVIGLELTCQDWTQMLLPQSVLWRLNSSAFFLPAAFFSHKSVSALISKLFVLIVCFSLLGRKASRSRTFFTFAAPATATRKGQRVVCRPLLLLQCMN